MKGVVTQANVGYAFIASPGEDFFAHVSEVPTDEVGRRYLATGERIEFDAQQTGKAYRCAVNVRILSPREPVDPDSYVEEGTVDKVSRHGDFCFVLRPHGGVAMLHADSVREVESKYDDGRPYFFKGQVWSYRLTPPLKDEHRAWLAVNACELVAEESATV